MRLRRANTALLTLALVGLVFALDLFWGAVSGTSAGLAYGLLDEPAHLATAIVLVLALAAFGTRLSKGFIAGAVVASVAIDIDHIPGILGSPLLTGGEPRPYSHSLIAVLALVLVGRVARGRTRQLALGAAFGVGAHLLRDLATGPGVPLVWPVSGGVVTLPYAVFAGLLALAALTGAVAGWSAPARGRFGLAAVLVFLGFAGLALVPPSASAAPAVGIGAYIPGADTNPSLINNFGNQIGQPAIVLTYKDWTSAAIDPGELDAIWSRGSIPMVTWEPWSWADPARRFPLRAIARGRYDAYIRRAAQAAAAWGHPILLRFAHEMNGTWYPWGRGRDGNTPGLYKRAWRHLVRIFRRYRARNVEWVWTPNVDNTGHLPFKQFYPGDNWVDWVGLDGLNWGGSRWQSFGQIFARSYHQLTTLTSKPVVIAETGSSETGGNKSAWVSNALNRAIPSMAHIRAVIWWDQSDPRGDFRVNSSPAALAAFRRGIGKRRYRAGRHRLLMTSGALRPRAGQFAGRRIPGNR